MSYFPGLVCAMAVKRRRQKPAYQSIVNKEATFVARRDKSTSSVKFGFRCFQIYVVGYIKGFKRRFYQHSVDHRGRPDKPGRVVTLIPSHPDDSVWGVAYEIYKRDESFVTAHLDYREKTGYKKQNVTFYPTQVVHNNPSDRGDSWPEGGNLKLEPFDLMIYIGTEDNRWFAGPASIEEMARQIFESEGPSGTNKEYLYNLASAMRAMAPHVNDEHLFDLEKAVRDLEKSSKL